MNASLLTRKCLGTITGGKWRKMSESAYSYLMDLAGCMWEMR